jgi:hypothetical protein
MQIDSILAHNKNIMDQYHKIQELLEVLETSQEGLLNSIKAPCEFCPLDGLYRCEACKEHDYEGFNDKEWYGRFYG